jgi:hypothetical protein
MVGFQKMTQSTQLKGERERLYEYSERGEDDLSIEMEMVFD